MNYLIRISNLIFNETSRPRFLAGQGIQMYMVYVFHNTVFWKNWIRVFWGILVTFAVLYLTPLLKKKFHLKNPEMRILGWIFLRL